MIASETVLDEIRRHAQETYPEECCGFLLGKVGESGNEIHATARAVNRNENRRQDRYVISPDDYRSAAGSARKAGLEIVGIYHSHPDHPARPSTTDLETATFPGYTYAIVSVRGGRAAELTAWSLAPDRSEFRSEEIREAAGT